MYHKKPLLFLLGLIVLLALGGCQALENKRKIDYGKTRTLPPLEVPPDLTAPPSIDLPSPTGNTGTLPDSTAEKTPRPAPGAASGPVLPEYPGVKLARDGQTRWLVVAAEPAALWNQVREFVLANGLLVAEENPQTGTIETDWAENRAKIGTGTQKILAKILGSLYSTGTRDKYRLRLERGIAPGTTEIYLSHQGMEEVLPEGNVSGTASTIWRPRPSDSELEAEMLQRLTVYLGGQQTVARQEKPEAPSAAPDKPTTVEARPPAPVNAALARNGSGAPILSLQDSLERAWRRVGLSLDRIGFTVEDRDRSKGVYYVRYIDPDQPGRNKGFISRWFGGKDKEPSDQYQVLLTAAEAGTQVEVLGKNGAPDASKTGERILSLLYEQLK